MAPLTGQDKQEIRNFMEQKAYETGIAVRWIKAAIHDAAQAIEDIEGGTYKIQCPEDKLLSIVDIGSREVDAATAPYGLTLTNQEKKWLRAKVLERRFIKDKV